MTPRYFIGDTITGPVKASNAHTFKDLVDRFIVVPVPVNISSATYRAKQKLFEGKTKLTTEERDAKKWCDSVKSVAYLTACTFNTSPAERNYANATQGHCNLIFLDIDVDKETGRSPAAKFVSHPDLLAKRLSPFSWCAYTTASSTPEKPRMRLMVSAEKLELSEYPAAVRTIAALIGLEKVTAESLVPVQAMYCPVLFNDQDEEYEHPLFARDLEGREFTSDDIEDNDTSTEKRARPARDAVGGDLLEFLKAPVPEITLAIASEMLDHLDADMDYRQWLEVCAALRHQFTGRQEADAYELFDQWSSKGQKYAGEEETAQKWASFKHTSAGRMPVTIRTLVHLASLAGWDNKAVKEDCFNSVYAWIQNVTSQNALLGEGLQRIAATPLLSLSQEDMLVLKVVAQSKKLGFLVTPTAVRKDLSGVKEQLRAKEEKQVRKDPPWAKGIIYISAHDEFFRHKNGERLSPMAFDRAHSRWLLPTENDLLAQGKPITPGTLCTPTVQPTQYALNELKVPVAFDYEYNPAEPNELFTRSGGKTFVNTYVRTYPEPDPAGSKAAGALFVGHLEKLIAEAVYRRTVLDFMAYLVQHPGRKIRWAILIQGCEGCGKTFLFDTLCVILGKQNTKPIGGQAIFKGWSEWATGYQLVVIEEVKVDGANKHIVMDTMKPFITNEYVNIEQRNNDSRERINRTNYMLFSNHHNALALTPGDRRYFVVKSPMQTKAQVLALGGKAHFDPLYAMLRDNAGGLRHFFENWQISDDFDPDGHAPATTYLSQLVEDSASESVATVRRLIKETENALIMPDMISSSLLLDMCHGEGLNRLTSQGLAAILREESYTNDGRYLIGKVQHSMWVHTASTFESVAAEARRRYDIGASHEYGYLLV